MHGVVHGALTGGMRWGIWGLYLFDEHEVEAADLRLRATRGRRVMLFDRLTQTQLRARSATESNTEKKTKKTGQHTRVENQTSETE